jgi:hypothetical protein
VAINGNNSDAIVKTHIQVEPLIRLQVIGRARLNWSGFGSLFLFHGCSSGGMCEIVAGLFLKRIKCLLRIGKGLTVLFGASLRDDAGVQTELCNVEAQILSFGSFFAISLARLNAFGGLLGSADFCFSLLQK